jgi:hypothetical protein
LKTATCLNYSRNGRRRNKGDWWRGWIQAWHIWYIVRTFANATMYPKHNNKEKSKKKLK